MKIKPGLRIRNISGENIVVLPNDSHDTDSTVLSLNATSVFLWTCFAGREFEKDDVSALLLARYRIEDEVAIRDADLWISKLVEAGAIE